MTTMTIPSHVTETVPFVTWEEFVQNHFVWEQGEHLALIGPTGSGKTTLAKFLLPMRRYVVVFGTKPADDTMRELMRQGYRRMENWDAMSPALYPRRILWPKVENADSIKRQQIQFARAFDAIYRERNWCLYIDELWYIIHFLKLEKAVRWFLQQGRSIGITLMIATQRPAFIPLEVYDQSTHLFFWRDNDERNLKRISGISWLSSRKVQQAVAHLAKHEVLYVNTRDGVLIRTKVELGA